MADYNPTVNTYYVAYKTSEKNRFVFAGCCSAGNEYTTDYDVNSYETFAAFNAELTRLFMEPWPECMDCFNDEVCE